MANGDKRRRQLVETLRHPQQGRDRVAQRRRLDEAFEIIEQRCVRFGQWSRAAAFTANLPRGKWRRIEVFQSALNGTARQPGDVRDGSETTPSGGARLARCKQPPTALVPFRTVPLPPLPNRVPIDHATLVRRRAAPRNRPPPSHTVAGPFNGNLDSLIVATVLSAMPRQSPWVKPIGRPGFAVAYMKVARTPE